MGAILKNQYSTRILFLNERSLDCPFEHPVQSRVEIERVNTCL